MVDDQSKSTNSHDRRLKVPIRIIGKPDKPPQTKSIWEERDASQALALIVETITWVDLF